MKRIIINSIVVILLNTQIYGCFNHVEVREAVVSPTSESNSQEPETIPTEETSTALLPEALNGQGLK